MRELKQFKQCGSSTYALVAAGLRIGIADRTDITGNQGTGKAKLRRARPAGVGADKTVPTRTALRQTDWASRQGARGAMMIDDAIDSIPITDVIMAPITQAQPAGSLLLEVQGQVDLAMAEQHAQRLGRQMKSKGLCSDTTIEEGLSDGLAAVTIWRNQYTVRDANAPSARAVCWQAVQRSMSADAYGDTDSLDTFNPDSLAESAMPLPQLVGDDSRTDKAARLLFERARAKRPALLARRIAAIKAQGGRGKRAELVERVGRACLLMLQGESLEQAATLAGFKGASGGAGRGDIKPGDRLARALRRLGFRVQLSLRQVGKDIAKPEHVSAGRFHNVASVPFGPVKGNSKALVERVGRACRLLLMDAAATRHGRAAGTLAQAVRRLGFRPV